MVVLQAVLIPSKLILHLFIENEINDAILKMVCFRIARYTFFEAYHSAGVLEINYVSYILANLNIKDCAFWLFKSPALV